MQRLYRVVGRDLEKIGGRGFGPRVCLGHRSLSLLLLPEDAVTTEIVAVGSRGPLRRVRACGEVRTGGRLAARPTAVRGEGIYEFSREFGTDGIRRVGMSA